jgi:hypothetical protein
MEKKVAKKNDSAELLVKQADTILLKDLMKLFGRIERIFIPSGTLVYNDIFERLDALSKEIQRGSCFTDVKEFSNEEIDRALSKNSEVVIRKIDWEKFIHDLSLVSGNGDESYQLPFSVMEEIDRERGVHEGKLKKGVAKEKIRQLQVCLLLSYASYSFL